MSVLHIAHPSSPRSAGPGPVVVLYTRDLRVHDHPALAAARRDGRRVVPLFVLDPKLTRVPAASANRLAFLLESLADLRSSLVERGGLLVVREGDPVEETLRVATESGATDVSMSADVSSYASVRERRLASECSRLRLGFRSVPGVTVVAPGSLVPTGRDHDRVFTPYWRARQGAAIRPGVRAPGRLDTPAIAAGRLPALARLSGRPTSPLRTTGGETTGRARAKRWMRTVMASYPERPDDLAGDRTSRLSACLHFGCLSPLSLVRTAEGRPGGQEFVRQLCWRAVHHQVAAAFPELPRRDDRPSGRRWMLDDGVLAAWREGVTGIPVVDAGVRQLRAEGWMHNRRRLPVAFFLTKLAGIDWRLGQAHVSDWLLDGDVANNAGNRRWVAGTGNDTRPNRRFNVLRQAQRFDPSGDDVRRYVPELRSLEAPSVHAPGRLGGVGLARLGYPEPVLPELAR